MPANLTPDYLEAEARLRQARTAQEKVAALEDMLRTIPKHKGTDHMQADIKKRLAQAKKDALKKPSKSGSSQTMYVKPEGIGQVFLVGPPNSGKSTLLDLLTNAKPEVAPYPFTTQMYQPGMMRHENVWIQLVDMPPVSSEAPLPWIPSVVRYGDAALFVLSLGSDDLLHEIDDVRTILEESKVKLAGKNEEWGQFPNGVAALKTLLVLTHSMDEAADDRLELLFELIDHSYDYIRVEALEPATVEALRPLVYGMLGLIRVYAKQPGKQPDLQDPFVLKAGSTVEALAEKIHKDILKGLEYARVWNQSSGVDGLRVPRDQPLREGDVVELHWRGGN